MYEISLRKRSDRTPIFVLKRWYKFTSLEAFHPPMKLFKGVENEKWKKRILTVYGLD